MVFRDWRVSTAAVNPPSIKNDSHCLPSVLAIVLHSHRIDALLHPGCQQWHSDVEARETEPAHKVYSERVWLGRTREAGVKAEARLK